MKKSNVITTFVLTTALCFGSLVSVSARTNGTYENETNKPDVSEYSVEKYTAKYMNEVASGKYKSVDTDTLKGWIDKNEKMVIIDTMPASSYSNGHIPGALNAQCDMTDETFSAEQKANLLSTVEKAVPKKAVKKTTSTTTWSKVSKKTYKKLSKANRKTKKVKKGKKKVTYYYKKVVKKTTKTTYVTDKSYKVVVYCGFVRCPRSHQAAKYLVQQGYTNVWRQCGGIYAWIDAGYDVEKDSSTTDQTTTDQTTTDQTATDSQESTNTQDQTQTTSDETTETAEQPAA